MYARHAIAGAAHVYESEYSVHQVQQASIEPHIVLTWWDEQDDLGYAVIGTDRSVLDVDTLRQAPNRNANERAVLRQVLRASGLSNQD